MAVWISTSEICFGVRPLFEGAPRVGFDLVGAAEGGEHGEHDHAALLAAEAIARPGAAPAVLVQQLLQGFAELGGVVQGGIDVFVAQHFAPDFKPAFFLEFSAVVSHLAMGLRKRWLCEQGLRILPGPKKPSIAGRLKKALSEASPAARRLRALFRRTARWRVPQPVTLARLARAPNSEDSWPVSRQAERHRRGGRMSDRIQGLHHITLCTGTAQGDVDFFVKTLGLRLMKRTLLYDGVEPIYHLYFGDEMGSPGNLTTTFPWRRTGRKARPAPARSASSATRCRRARTTSGSSASTSTR